MSIEASASQRENPSPLAEALTSNKEVAEEVERAADDLSVVHAVLDTKIVTGAMEDDVNRAIAETKRVEERLNETAEKLEQVNETLERELRNAR